MTRLISFCTSPTVAAKNAVVAPMKVTKVSAVGVSTAAVVTWQLEHRPHPEQGYRACLGLQRLAREYTPARLEAACTRALAIRSPTYRSVASILKTGLDRQPSLLPTTTAALPAHENVRGPDYYH